MVAKKKGARGGTSRRGKARACPQTVPATDGQGPRKAGVLTEETIESLRERMVEWNPRIMPAKEMAALRGSLSSFGVLDPVVVNRTTGHVLGGHQRIVAAGAEGVERLPVYWVDVPESKEKAANLALNRISGSWEPALLSEILEHMDETALLGATGFTDEEVRAILAGAEYVPPAWLLAPQTPDEVVDPPVPEPPDDPVTKLGDLIVMGEHRLVCGDSGSEEDLDHLLDGAPIHLLNMDPPYNVKVEPRSNNAISAGLSSFSAPKTRHHQALDLARHPGKSKPTHRKMRAKDRPLINDFLSDEEFALRLRAWFKNAARVLEPGRAFYIWGGYANIANYPSALKEAALYFSQTIIWDKQHPVLTRKDFMGAHEWCFYGWREGAGHKFLGPANITDLWAVKKVTPQSMVHLTEKPVELAARALAYSSTSGENVLDLFGGSGSTLMACEQMGRRAFLMELDPAYADVIVERWETFTGQKAKRPRRRRGKKSATARAKRKA